MQYEPTASCNSAGGLPEAHDHAVANFLCWTTAGFCILARYPPYPDLMVVVRLLNHLSCEDGRAAYNRHPCTPNDDEGERENKADLVGDVFLDDGHRENWGFQYSCVPAMLTCVHASKLSAQSPAWRRNARFCCTWLSCVLSLSIWKGVR